MNDVNNIKYLCNFLKKDIVKYKNIINQIINNDNINDESKEIFLFNILNDYNKDNKLLLGDKSIKLLIKNLKRNNIYNIILFEEYTSLNNILLYKIFNNNIFGKNEYQDTEIL